MHAKKETRCQTPTEYISVPRLNGVVDTGQKSDTRRSKARDKHRIVVEYHTNTLSYVAATANTKWRMRAMMERSPQCGERVAKVGMGGVLELAK